MTGMRDKIIEVVGSEEIADQVLQLFEQLSGYDTPANDDPRQDEMPHVLKSFQWIQWTSPREPAYETSQPE